MNRAPKGAPRFANKFLKDGALDMFKIFQATMIVAALALAFGAGYEMKPSRVAPKKAEIIEAIEEVPAGSQATDIRIPVGQATPLAEIPVDQKDIAYKWIQKELGINTSILDPKDKETLTVLQPLEKKTSRDDPKPSP